MRPKRLDFFSLVTIYCVLYYAMFAPQTKLLRNRNKIVSLNISNRSIIESHLVISELACILASSTRHNILTLDVIEIV